MALPITQLWLGVKKDFYRLRHAFEPRFNDDELKREWDLLSLVESV
jgi:hypothetical protein